MTRLRWTIEDARTALAAWQVSGISMKTFATRKGLDAQRLYRWRRRLEEEVPAPGAVGTPEFIELRPHEAPPVEVVLRSGRVLRVSETIDATALVHLVRALEEEPA